MSNVALLLGPVTFQDFEVPTSINIGGAQRLTIHRLPGGSRIIDTMGRDDADISFSGIFSGADATIRARSIDQMRVSGISMPLTWDVFFYSVIIKSFTAEYQSGWWIPYRITCAVVVDQASSVVAAVISLADNALTDVTTACTFALAAGIDLSTTTRAVGKPNACVRGTVSYTSTLVEVGEAVTLVGRGISKAEIALNAASWADRDDMSAAANAFNATIFVSRQISLLAIARGYIGRASVNLANAST
jgi:hypothetical protein